MPATSQRGGTPSRPAPAPGGAPAAPRRWLFLGPPPRPSQLAGWALLPLRAFLGFTFCFAGLQKLANPTFWSARNPAGIQAQMLASSRVSPLHALLTPLVHHAVPIGAAIAVAELAVGLGVLVGLWTRVAAAGGMVLALTLFLTVSFHTSPYYTGADIVFLFAFTPLVIAGSGQVLSLDAVLASRSGLQRGTGPSAPVHLTFGRIQQLCGKYEDDRCAARGGAPCDIRHCPALLPTAAGGPTAGSRDDATASPGTALDRRRVVIGVGAAAAVGVVAGVGVAAGRLAGGASGPEGASTSTLGTTAPKVTTPTSAPPPGTATTVAPTTPTTAGGKTPRGVVIGTAADVAVGGAATFTDPLSGDPAIVLQPATDQFVAFDAVCPHAGCTVAFSPAADLMICPCHGSRFNATTGAVVHGPAPHGLREIAVAEGPDGNLYAE